MKLSIFATVQTLMNHKILLTANYAHFQYPSNKEYIGQERQIVNDFSKFHVSFLNWEAYGKILQSEIWFYDKTSAEL